MTWSKCEQCDHRFYFDEVNETQPCPECNFETRLFPVPRPVSPPPARGTIPADVPINREAARAGLAAPGEFAAGLKTVALILIAGAYAAGLAFGGDGLRETLIFLGSLVGGGLLYFVPALAATNHQHPNRQAIFILNLFAGWTIIGWIAALVWAFARPQGR